MCLHQAPRSELSITLVPWAPFNIGFSTYIQEMQIQAHVTGKAGPGLAFPSPREHTFINHRSKYLTVADFSALFHRGKVCVCVHVHVCKQREHPFPAPCQAERLSLACHHAWCLCHSFYYTKAWFLVTSACFFTQSPAGPLITDACVSRFLQRYGLYFFTVVTFFSFSFNTYHVIYLEQGEPQSITLWHHLDQKPPRSSAHALAHLLHGVISVFTTDSTACPKS